MKHPEPPTRERARFLKAVLRVGIATIGAAALGIVIIVPLDMQSQAIFGAAMFATAWLVHRFAGHLASLTLIILSITASTRYLWWRLSMTVASDLSLDTALGGVLLLAELYAYAMLLLGYFQSLFPLARKPIPLPTNSGAWPTVDVYIPTYNEPLEVVRTTIQAALSIDWPADKMRIYLLDDGRREAFRVFAAQAGVSYITRPDNKHAKAGNLNHALKQTDGEYVAIFDCDHVPTRSFLQTTMGWFLRDRKLAMMQTPHHFYSPDPFERNLQTFRRVPNEGELFYGLIQPTNDLWNAVFFCGSCAVLRRSALEGVGGVAVETVTEDAHTALKMHRRGWSTGYLAIPQAAGLATESLAAHVGQRIRWARGMAQIFRVDNPLFGKGLSLAQRLCYTGSMMHFLYGIPRIVFLLAPLAYLLFDLQIFNALPLVVIVHWLPHLFHSILTNSRLQGGFRHSFWSELYETCLAAYITIPTTVALFNPKAGSFNVTAKGGQIENVFFDRKIAIPYVALLSANVFGLGLGLGRLWLGEGQLGVLAANLFWCGHNSLILAATAAVAWEARQVRKKPRIPVSLPAMLRFADGRTVRCKTQDMSISGASLEVSSQRALHRGDRMWLSVRTAEDEFPLPVQVVGTEGGSVRVAFDGLDAEQEAALVRTIFSRADAWVEWGNRKEGDKPLGSFVRIAATAVGSLFRLIRGLTSPRGAA